MHAAARAPQPARAADELRRPRGRARRARALLAERAAGHAHRRRRRRQDAARARGGGRGAPGLSRRRLLRRPLGSGRARASSPRQVGPRARRPRAGRRRRSRTCSSGALRDAELLLVLDNCEHVREACGELVEHLLAACPRLRVLATSREPLGVARRGRLPGAAARAARGGCEPGRARSSEAVRLFLARAREARPRPRRTTTRRSRPRRASAADLDGLPLALELAAARAKALSLDEIASRLARPLPLPRLVAAADRRPATGRSGRRWTGATSSSAPDEQALLAPALRLRRRLHARSRRGGLRRRRRGARRSSRRAARRRLARRRRGARRRDALPPARDGAPVRGRAARRGRRGRGACGEAARGVVSRSSPRRPSRS